MDISFPFPRRLVSAIAGLEEAKNLAGESPPPDSDLFDDGRVLKKSRLLVKQTRPKRRSQIRVPEKPSAFHPHAQRTAFRRRDAHQQSRSFAPRNPRLRRSPQLQAALPRVSVALLIVVDHLRRRSATADSSCGEFARFKLCAHLLDLRCLLSHRRCEGLNFLLL